MLGCLQSLVNDVSRDFLCHFAFVYLDDILIFSRTPVEHQTHVRSVLQKLLWRTACISKWRNVSFMPFLGFVIAGEDGPAQGSSSPPQSKLQLCAFFS